jgi:F-type H+-transporting ATPase subunit gamma
LIVAISSDRGLCGGIHSGIVKTIKLDLAEKKNVENVKIVAVGDKARGILQR